MTYFFVTDSLFRWRSFYSCRCNHFHYLNEHKFPNSCKDSGYKNLSKCIELHEHWNEFLLQNIFQLLIFKCKLIVECNIICKVISKYRQNHTITCYSIICSGISIITRTGKGSISVFTILCTIISVCTTFIHIWRIKYSLFTYSRSVLKSIKK